MLFCRCDETFFGHYEKCYSEMRQTKHIWITPLIFTLLIEYGMTAVNSLECEEGWIHSTASNKCFYVYHSTTLVHKKADEMCTAMGGTLASLAFEEDLTIIQESLSPDTEYWISLYANICAGDIVCTDWEWGDGSEMTSWAHDNWVEGEPNTAEGVARLKDMKWAGIQSSKSYGAICQKAIDPSFTTKARPASSFSTTISTASAKSTSTIATIPESVHIPIRESTTISHNIVQSSPSLSSLSSSTLTPTDVTKTEAMRSMYMVAGGVSCMVVFVILFASVGAGIVTCQKRKFAKKEADLESRRDDIYMEIDHTQISSQSKNGQTNTETDTNEQSNNNSNGDSNSSNESNGKHLEKKRSGSARDIHVADIFVSHTDIKELPGTVNRTSSSK